MMNLNSRRVSISLIATFVVFGIFFGISFAYFSTRSRGNDAAQDIDLKTANVELLFVDGDSLNMSNITPGATASKIFRVENNNNSNYTYSVIWTSIANGFGDLTMLTYEIQCVSYSDYPNRTVSSNPCSGLNSAYSPESSTNPVGIISGNEIYANEVHEYTVTFTVDSNLPPEAIVSFSGTFGINPGTVTTNHNFVP